MPLSNNSSQSAEEEGGEEEESEEGVDPSEEALIQAFGETAVQGVTWLVNVMGLNVNQSNNNGTASSGQQQQSPTTQPAPVNV